MNSDFICFRPHAQQKFLALLKFRQKSLLNLTKFYRPVLFVVLKLGITSSACKYAVLFGRRFYCQSGEFRLACSLRVLSKISRVFADVKFCLTDFLSQLNLKPFCLFLSNLTNFGIKTYQNRVFKPKLMRKISRFFGFTDCRP